MPITKLQFTRKFERDLKALDVKLLAAAKDAVRDILKDPIPSTRRFHILGGYKPKDYTIDVLSNHSYKISFEIDGETAILRRVASHVEIDRLPR